MELTKVLRVEEDLIQKLSMPGFLPQFLARAHLLFKAVKGTLLLLAGGVDLCPFVEVSINELSLVKSVALSLGLEVLERDFVLQVSLEYLLPHTGLEWLEFESLQEHLCLLSFIRRGAWVFD